MQTRPSNIAAVLGVLAAGSLASACKSPGEAVEVPSQPPSRGDASCRHELGRCGGHKPGDGACGAESAPAPSGDTHVSKDIFTALVIEPGEFAEMNLQMLDGAAVTVEFAGTGAPIGWNVHSHAGEQTIVHAEGGTAADTVRFVADHDGVFSYLWQNKGRAPLTLDVKLRAEGAVTLHSTHPAR